MDIVQATNKAIDAATHLTDVDAGAVQAVRDLAVKIAVMDEYFEALYQDAVDSKRRPPYQDNVSIPTYLKYCEALGLTPAGRVKLGEKKPEGRSGKLTGLRSVPKPKSA